ncbi:MAG: Dabb family protein [Verrucomicrobia bacterium]|nr:Dabb family protein [Verrucomicrobiota bacterium]MDA1007004.1 Dabb family protein [Verrucomicrobiota bacterium]
MIAHLAFYKLQPEVDPERLETMVRTTRSLLLKIPEILGVHSGRNTDPNSEWPFFFSIDVSSLAKLEMVKDDPLYLKFLESVIRPNTAGEFAFSFETDPTQDLRYS